MRARRIVARGGNVAIFDLNAERGGELVSELGDQTAFFECNVMEEESIDAAVAGAHEKFGALHGAVNCAGGQIGTGLTVNRRGEATDMETWWKTVQLNLYSTMAVCSKVLAISALQDENASNKAEIAKLKKELSSFRSAGPRGTGGDFVDPRVKCFKCGKSGHKQSDCPNEQAA